jgi:hypothetical protein
MPADHMVRITDNDSWLGDGTDDRDDKDSNQIVEVFDENGVLEASGQVQPRDEITLSDGTNTFRMTEIYIASSNSYYYIFQEPAPSLNTAYTGTNVSSPNSTNYSSFSSIGVTCFAQNTMIRTSHGARRIENLEQDDIVMTLDAAPQPVVWLGTRLWPIVT